MSNVRVERMRPGHWPAVRSIYEAGIATGNATLERDAPDWESWDAAHRSDCRLVAVDGDRVLGWVALAPYSSRTVYEGVAWLSVYVTPDAQRRGIGRRLPKTWPAWPSTSAPASAGSASTVGSVGTPARGGGMWS
jgi:phosphinothricin acetyltransferase